MWGIGQARHRPPELRRRTAALEVVRNADRRVVEGGVERAALMLAGDEDLFHRASCVEADRDRVGVALEFDVVRELLAAVRSPRPTQRGAGALGG